MSRGRKVFGSLVLATLLALSPTPQAGEPAEIRVEPAELELAVGESTTLRATVLDADGGELALGDRLLFLSLARRALEIDDTGRVTAHRPGDHAVLVMLPDEEGGREDALSLRVPVHVPRPAVTALTIELPEPLWASTRVETRIVALDAAGERREIDDTTVVSDDPEIVAVDALGNLVAVADGDTTVRASYEGAVAERAVTVLDNPAVALELEADNSEVRTGDVVHLTATARDAEGRPLPAMPVQLAFRARTDQAGIGEPSSGHLTEDGRFVADLPGEYTIVATVGDLWATETILAEPRDVGRGFELVGHGPVRDRFTSDLWVWEGTDGRDYALTGTWSADGHAYLWDVTDPGNMQRIDTIRVDARTVNDVKVSADGRIAVISREGASNRRNGLVILDVSEPAAGMRVLARYDDELTGGVHNVFIYQDHVYALSAGRRYDIINIEDPTNPHRVGRFELDTPGHSIHDVWVREGVAWSSNWADGVVAVDVGGGGMGGSPRNPVLMGQQPDPSGRNHAAFPYRSESTGKLYVFAGDEAGLSGVTPDYDDRLDLMAGYIHVLEWDEEGGEHRAVARYEVPEAGSHNLWVQDDILYIAYYQGGLRAVDVSGELLGDLYRQGREIGYFKPLDPEGWVPNVAMTWGPQPHKGNVFFSDMHSGLWAVRLGVDGLLSDPEAR